MAAITTAAPMTDQPSVFSIGFIVDSLCPSAMAITLFRRKFTKNHTLKFRKYINVFNNLPTEASEISVKVLTRVAESVSIVPLEIHGPHKNKASETESVVGLSLRLGEGQGIDIYRKLRLVVTQRDRDRMIERSGSWSPEEVQSDKVHLHRTMNKKNEKKKATLETKKSELDTNEGYWHKDIKIGKLDGERAKACFEAAVVLCKQRLHVEIIGFFLRCRDESNQQYRQTIFNIRILHSKNIPVLKLTAVKIETGQRKNLTFWDRS